MNPTKQAVIVQPGDGKPLQAFGNTLAVFLSGAQTNGTLAVCLEQTPPGGGPPLHVHADEDELFLVVEGCIRYFAHAAWTEVGVGGAVYLPRGTPHCYRNVGESPSRHWIITTPAGFEDFFTESAEEFAKPGGPDMDSIVTIHHNHGIEILEQP